jgi:hypothetical protein
MIDPAYFSVQDSRPIEQPIWIQVLRWIAILPGAVIGACIITIISGIVMWLGFSRFGGDTWFDLIWRGLITNGAGGAAFVYCAAWVAPKGNIPVAITFSSIVLFISGSRLPSRNCGKRLDVASWTSRYARRIDRDISGYHAG